MAVKVRCPTCEKVLSAPDTARGKAVKCPGCDTKVKVPAGDTSAGGQTTSRRATAKAPARQRAQAEDDDEFLAGLDLDKVIDSSESMCPKCGASIPEDATECPKCGVDPETGQLSASAKKRAGRKGPDPSLFYSAAWKDSWAFTMENKSVAIRTALYMIVFAAVQGGCNFMTNWSTNLPPKIFWAAMYFVTGLIIPGWIWCLTVETVKTTVARKTSIRQVHFDAFQNMALGIKLYLWSLVFWVWFPIAFLMYPLAMIHMAMPVTKRGWFNLTMFATFFRNFLPTMYYWLVFIVTNLVNFALIGLAAFFALVPILERIRGIQAGNAPPPAGASFWVSIGVALTLLVLATFVGGFTLIFNMRVIGLLAYYFKDTLDLVVVVADKTYVRREVKVDQFGDPITTPGQIVLKILLVIVVLAVIAGAGFLVWYMLFKK
jgi:ribosomal protein L40E/phage FluMu protein Com